MEENIMEQDSGMKKIEPFSVSRMKHANPDSDQRLPRSSSARKTRVEDERPPIVFGGGSKFNLQANVVKKVKDSGKVLGFVVYSSGNTDQRENYFDAMERGWVPLDARDFPELKRQYQLSPFANREEDYLIRRGGQIAMMRDKEIDDAENAHYNAERRRQEVLSEMYAQTDPRHPKPFMDERSRERIRIR